MTVRYNVYFVRLKACSSIMAVAGNDNLSERSLALRCRDSRTTEPQFVSNSCDTYPFQQTSNIRRESETLSGGCETVETIGKMKVVWVRVWAIVGGLEPVGWGCETRVVTSHLLYVPVQATAMHSVRACVRAYSIVFHWF